MLSRGRLIFLFFSLATVLLVLTGTLLASTAARGKDDGKDSLYKYLAVFTEVLSLVDRAYVDDADMESLMAGAFEGAADALDPFSLYVPSSEVDAYIATREVGTSRSGLLILKERGVAYAASVTVGGPADEAGIRRGDVIALIGEKSTRKMPLFRLHTLLAGPVGTKLELETIRMGVKETVELVLKDFTPPGVDLSVRDGVGVLRIDGFHADTKKNVEVSLDEVRSGSALPELKDRGRLLIDLRGIAGGEETAAYEVAGLFVSGELGVLKARDDVLEVFSSGEKPRYEGRLVVLLDRGTQGPAEVLATVLHQQVGATLVGTYSFGHSGRQTLVRLSNGGRLQLTDAFYTGPDREPIQEGLEPDVAARQLAAVDTDGEPEDAILEKGLEVLLAEEEVEQKQAA